MAAASLVVASSSHADESAKPTARDTCRAVLESRVRTCAQACIDRAKAAVAPEVRDRILGHGCTNNCIKLEMFAGHTCPPAP